MHSVFCCAAPAVYRKSQQRISGGIRVDILLNKSSVRDIIILLQTNFTDTLREEEKTMSDSIRFLLGIDGGGTKTHFVLADPDGKEIKTLLLGASNPVNIGTDAACAVLSEGISRICEGLDPGTVSVFAGVAGAATGDNRKIIADFLSGFGFAFSDCGSDIDLALETALHGENGTAAIMGTGIVAYSRSGEKLHRSGGRGFMIDRGGSGFHFGADALNAAFEFLDGRGGSETILKLVEEKLGKSLESADGIYKGGATYIASFAPAVFEAFRSNDPTAAQIIDRNAFEAAKIINGARRALNLRNDRIVICGGLGSQKEILYPFLTKYIEGEASLTFLDEPTVNGALALARRMKKC